MSNVSGVVDTVFQSAQAGNANGTAMDTGGLASVTAQVTGTGFTGTVNFEGTVDGNFKSVLALPLSTGGSGATSTTADGLWSIPCAGLAQVRCRTSGVSAGSVTVTGKGVGAGSSTALVSVSAKAPVQHTDGTTSTPNASAATLTAAQTGQGAETVTDPAEWAITHAPAVNVQATISKAAGGAGVRHVCSGFSFTVAAGGTAPAATQLTVNLRDGAAGAGTILQSWTVAIPATAGAFVPFGQSGLRIPGSAATAMTLEFAAAGGANTYESVNLRGFDVN